MALKYSTGDEVLKGDHISLAGNPGVIEFIVEQNTKEPELIWYAEECGEGAMVLTDRFGRIFTKPGGDEDLRLVRRA